MFLIRKINIKKEDTKINPAIKEPEYDIRKRNFIKKGILGLIAGIGIAAFSKTAQAWSGFIKFSDATEQSAAYTDAKAVSAVGVAGLTFAENKTIILDALLSADEKWSGISEIGTMGYAATVGDLVYLSVTDTKWELADADAASTSKGKLGLVLATTAEDSTCQVLLYGKMRSAAFPEFTVGAPVHVGTTVGDVQVGAPTGTGDIVRIVGYGNTAEDLFFCPDNTYVELA